MFPNVQGPDAIVYVVAEDDEEEEEDEVEDELPITTLEEVLDVDADEEVDVDFDPDVDVVFNFAPVVNLVDFFPVCHRVSGTRGMSCT